MVDASNGHDHSKNADANLISKFRDYVTFLPLKDLRFVETTTAGHTWFMSSLNGTYEENETELLYFPSEASKERLLCMKGRNKADCIRNSYAYAWPESLPDSATLVKGLTFVSDTYYDYGNLWYGLTAMAPFVGWSMKNGCLRPNDGYCSIVVSSETRWDHGYTITCKPGSEKLKVENFGGHRPYCFEKAFVIRHNEGRMGKARKLQVFD